MYREEAFANPDEVAGATAGAAADRTLGDAAGVTGCTTAGGTPSIAAGVIPGEVSDAILGKWLSRPQAKMPHRSLHNPPTGGFSCFFVEMPQIRSIRARSL